jgi:hypothetical protein
MLAKKMAHIDPEVDPLHDFRNFLFYCFEVLGLPAPDPMQYDIANVMQGGTPCRDGKIRQQIQAMRGCGKSVIAACYCCWLWYCNPDIRILYLGSNQDLVDISAKLVKDLLDNAELLQPLRPQDEDQYTMRHGKKLKSLAQSTNQTNQFDVRGRKAGRDSSFCGRPVFGGWTGRHPDVIVADDCEIPENSLTELKRRRLMDKLLECESLILDEGKILYMGTPQTEDSIYLKLHAQGYTITRWPAEIPDLADEKQCENVSRWLMERAEAEPAGSPSYPERFPVEVLLEKKAKSLAYYNLQMLLNPNLADEERYPLKLRNAILLSVPSDMAPSQIIWGTAEARHDIEHAGRRGDHWVAPASVSKEWQEYTGKVLYIDPKGGGADSVGYAVIGFLNGMVFVLDAGGLAPGTSGTSEATMRRLASIASEHEVRHVIVESNWGGSKDESTYARLLQPVLAATIGAVQVTLNHVSGQKEARILDCLEPIFNHHRIVFTEKAARKLEVSQQICRITRDRGALLHDDVIDAIYGGVSHFAEMVTLDPAKRREEAEAAERAASAKEFDRWTDRNTRWLDKKVTANPNPIRRGGWTQSGQRRPGGFGRRSR